jgi:hypothetical protein
MNEEAIMTIEATISDLMDGSIHDGKTRGTNFSASCDKAFSRWASARLRGTVQSLTSEQRTQVIEMMTQQAVDAYAAAETARKCRPSYAPAGRLTKDEIGKAAMLASAIEMLHGARRATKVG